MNYRDEIKYLLNSLLHDYYSYKEVVRLVHISSAIAQAFFKNYYPSFLQICTLHGMSEEDLAEDSVLQIFARDNQGEFFVLKNFTASLNFSLEETGEEELFVAWQAFVHTVALRQLIKTYSKIDSTGAKLYRNIMDSIRKMDELIVTREVFGLVIKPSNNSSHDHLPKIPFRQLEQRFKGVVVKPYTTPCLLSSAMYILQEQDTYRHSLPMFEAVKLFKKHYSQLSDTGNKKQASIDLSALTEFDHQIMKADVLKTIKEKILTTYVISGKINFKEANLLFQTVSDIVNGWFDGTKDKILYNDCTCTNFDIDNIEYEKNWRTKIEYLVRIARDQIKTYLLDGL